MNTSQRQYQHDLQKLIRQADKLDDVSAKRAIELLSSLRERVAAAIASAEGYEMIHLQRIMDEIGRVFVDFTNKYKLIMSEEERKAWLTGMNLVDEPLSKAGYVMQVTAMPMMSETQLGILQNFSADLITGVGTETIDKINKSLQLAIMGQKTPFEIMGEIGRNLKDPSIFRTLADRAEAITRTEINRVLNMSTIKRSEMASEIIPDMKKFWMHTNDNRTRPEHIKIGTETNPKYGGTPIPMKEDFVLNGPRGTEYAKGPHDPRLSAGNVIKCRCRLGFTI